MNIPSLGIIVPCYNEQEVLPETNLRLVALLAKIREEGLIKSNSAIFYIDDGSQDNTWQIIEEFSSQFSEVCGIKLSNNCGHQNALLCGLMTAPGDILISIDADLQDDLNAVATMVLRYLEGCDIVFGVRKSRGLDTLFKRFTAEAFYRLMLSMGVKIIFNHADYRLLSRRALNALSEYHEVNLFLRGIVRLLGFQSAIVEYDRAKRFAGESKYPLRKMLSLAWQGVTSFSTFPLKLITALGFLISLLSIALGIWGLVAKIILNHTVPGWTSTVVPMYLLGGIQLLALGIFGEYIAKIYLEVKARPRFHIEILRGNSFIEANSQAIN
jgi:glycosyltransferase involved in cell wall biosynthesis